MKTLFEVLKAIFLALTILIWLFFLRGRILLWEDVFYIVRDIITPGYLLLVGLMFAYIFALMNEFRIEDQSQLSKFFVKYFVMGILLGIALAVSFILFA